MPSSPNSANASSRLSAEHAKWLIHGAKDHAIFMFDSQGRILTWNPSVESILGYREDEWIGQNVSIFYTLEDVAAGEDVLERERAAGEGHADDLRWHVRRDGTRIWADGTVTPVFDDVASLVGFAKIMRDATARKQSQMALWHAEERLRLAASAAQIGTFDYDPRNDTLTLDDRCKTLFGLAPDTSAARYDAFLAGVHPEDREATDRSIRWALLPENGGVLSLRYRTIDAQSAGAVRWLSVKGQASFGGGSVDRFIGSVVDVTTNQAAGEALRQREEFLRRVLESSPDCIKTLSLDGAILTVNERGIEILEIEDISRFCGTKWAALWKDGDNDTAQQAVDTALAGGTGRFQGFAPTQKGAGKWWDVAVTPIRDADGRPEQLLVVSRDITAQHVAQRQEAFVSELTERLRSLGDPEAVAWETVRSCGEFFRLSRFLYAEIDEAAGVLQITHDWHDTEGGVGACAGTWQFEEWGRRIASWGATRDEMRAGRPVVISDCAADPLTAGDFEGGAAVAGKARAVIRIPLMRDGKWVAMLSAQSLSPRNWTADEAAVFKVVAERMWLTMENTRLHLTVKREADRERERLTSIFMQAPAFMATLRGPRHLFEMANPPYHALVGGREIIGKTVAEALPEVAAQGFLSLLDDVYQTAIPFVGRDMPIRLNKPGSDQLEDRYLDFTYQPIFDRDGDVSGILVHGVDLTDRKRLEQERERLHEEQGRLLAATSARAEREAILNRIGVAIRAAAEPEDVISIAVSSLGEALGLDRCFFNMFDATRAKLRIGADWHRGDIDSIAGEYSASTYERVVEEFYGSGNTVIIEDLEQADLSLEARTVQNRYGNRALLGIALRERDSSSDRSTPIVATLGAAMVGGPRIWTEGDIYLVESVATAIKTAMETARIRQRERNIAVQLQDALIPPSPSSPPGLALGSYYLPALEEAGVGGDAFDVFKVNDGCTALCVFDLSGKGLSAASQVATVKNMLRYAVFSDTSLAWAVTSLNQVLVDHDLLTGFATLIVGLYDHASRLLRYVNCGQEPGVVWRAASHQIELLMPTGPVLGGFDGGEFHEDSIVLAAGDVIALFTDGLTEVGASRKDLLEIDGVCDILQRCAQRLSYDSSTAALDPNAIVACLIEGIDAFARGGARDDIALLVGVVGADGDR